MKYIHSKFEGRNLKIILLSSMVILLSSCADSRGGIAVDSAGDQGGGTQPGGGGLGFSVLFLVVLVTMLGLFAMDRDRKNKEIRKQAKSEDE